MQALGPEFFIQSRREAALSRIPDVVQDINNALKNSREVGNHLVIFSADTLVHSVLREITEEISNLFIEAGWEYCIITYSEDNGERAGLVSIKLKE